MDLAERAIESAPSTRRRLIQECVYRRARFVPTRDKNDAMRTKYAYGIAAHLLQVDAKVSLADIARELGCDEAAAGTHAAYGKHLSEQSDDTLQLIAKIRDDVYERLEQVGIDVMLDESLAEGAPVEIVPLPTSIRGVVSLVSKTLGVKEGLITGLTHKTRELDARQIAMAVSQSIWPEQSRQVIGDVFGKRNSTTVLHALRQVDAVIRGTKDDPDLLRKIGTVCEKLGWDVSKLHFVPKMG